MDFDWGEELEELFNSLSREHTTGISGFGNKFIQCGHCGDRIIQYKDGGLGGEVTGRDIHYSLDSNKEIQAAMQNPEHCLWKDDCPINKIGKERGL